jgi:hypothetical protein
MNSISGYGRTQKESIRDLIIQLKQRNLYDYYCYEKEYIIIHIKNSEPSHVILEYLDGTWSSTVKLTDKINL